MSILTAIVSFEDSVFLASNRPRWLASEAKKTPTQQIQENCLFNVLFELEPVHIQYSLSTHDLRPQQPR